MTNNETMSYKTGYLRPLFLLPVVVSIMLGGGAADCLANQVAATLRQQAQILSLEISVDSPSPTSLIAIIKLPPQTKVATTSPKTAKLDPKKSQIKWLVKNPSPGTLRFSVTTSVSTDFSKVSAEVLYRKPGGDKSIKVDARKR